MLRALGCAQAQGFLFAEPVCGDEAQALMSTNWGRRLVPRIYSPARHAIAISNAC